MTRSLKKGYFIDIHLLDKVTNAQAKGDRKGHPHMVAPLDDYAGHGGPHDSRT